MKKKEINKNLESYMFSTIELITPNKKIRDKQLTSNVLILEKKMNIKSFSLIFAVCMVMLLAADCDGQPFGIPIPRNRYMLLARKLNAQPSDPNAWTASKYLKWRAMYGKRSVTADDDYYSF